MIFDRFRKIKHGQYDVREITQRVTFFEKIRIDSLKSSDYRVKDGETAISLAQDFYGNPELHWVLLYMNKIVDPHYDWVMPTGVFERYIKDKYQEPNWIKNIIAPDGRNFAVNQYQSSPNPLEDTNLIADVEASGVSVSECSIQTYRDYEEDLNEKKRLIRVIRPQYISGILDEFQKLMV